MQDGGIDFERLDVLLDDHLVLFVLLNVVTDLRGVVQIHSVVIYLLSGKTMLLTGSTHVTSIC